MRERSRVPDDQFKRYLEVRLGDKDHKKVLEMMSKVDKSMKSSVSSPAHFSWKGRGGRTPHQVQCFHCHQFGDYPDDDRIVSHDAIFYVCDTTSKLSWISAWNNLVFSAVYFLVLLQ